MTVELFRAPLDLEAHQLESSAATLSEDESRRAEALQSEQARRRWIADHGWRRRLLAARLGHTTPAEVTFTVSEHGKPALDGASLRFSASRSDGVAWYAVCDQAEVGIDVERIDRERPLDRLARRLLSTRERTQYETIPETQRADALYGCWTCKEAAVKALGSGLVFPLTALEAWTNDGSPVRSHQLEIRSLTPHPGQAAAVAVQVAPSDAVVITPVVDLSVPGASPGDAVR